MYNINIIGENFTTEDTCCGVYKYIAEDGYHFESYGINYGQVIYGGKTLTKKYRIEKDED